MYINKNNDLIKLKNNQEIELAPNSKNEYILYSTHRLDSSSSTQLQFKPYLDKMHTLNQDSLIAGNVYEFKKMHSELFENLTEYDSISIRFNTPYNEESLGETLKILAKYE